MIISFMGFRILPLLYLPQKCAKKHAKASPATSKKIGNVYLLTRIGRRFSSMRLSLNGSVSTPRTSPPAPSHSSPI